MTSLTTSPVVIYNKWHNFATNVTAPATIGDYTKESFVVDTKQNFEDNSTKETSIIQGLLPSTTYKITFDILKENGSGGYDPVSTDGSGDGTNLTPAQVQGVPPGSITKTPGEFHWNDPVASGLPAGSTLYYMTSPDSGFSTTITPVSWGNSRGPNGEPNDQAGYSSFSTNFRTYPIDTTSGVPDTTTFSEHEIDAFMFIFEKPETGDPTFNVNLTDTDFWNMVTTGATDDTLTEATLYHTIAPPGTPISYQKAKTYVGWNPSNPSKGVKKLTNIQEYTTINTTPLYSNEFSYILNDPLIHFPVITTYGPGGSRSGELRKDRKYYIALMFYDKTSKRIITNTTTNKPKWVSVLINFGGEWSISLGSFRSFVAQGLSLTNASAMTIDIDGIGLKGSHANGDLFKIVMKATPI
jgi:hypothetical protein